MFCPTGLLSAIESTISLVGPSRNPTEITSLFSRETRTAAKIQYRTQSFRHCIGLDWGWKITDALVGVIWVTHQSNDRFCRVGMLSCAGSRLKLVSTWISTDLNRTYQRIRRWLCCSSDRQTTVILGWWVHFESVVMGVGNWQLQRDVTGISRSLRIGK